MRKDVAFHNRQIDEPRWFTFAGGVINTALADAIRACGVNGVTSGDFLVKITEATGGSDLVERVRAMTADAIVGSFIVSDEFMEKLKFYECLPNRLAQELLRGRMLAVDDIHATLGWDVILVDEDS